LALDPIESATLNFILHVESYYADLTAHASSAPEASRLRPAISAEDAGFNPDTGLGGKLLYAGELDGAGRALLVAANIAGAASLAATADLAVQKQAIRDGVADFLVTTLDEALRILKNQIRKHETVAVCVAAAPGAVEREMLERGVLPDLLRPANAAAPDQNQNQNQSQTLLTWRVDAAPARWLPVLDSIALDCLPQEEPAARRWLRFAPRYLGRLTQGVRALRCEPETANEFVARVQLAVDRGEISVAVRISLNNDAESFLIRPAARVDATGAN
jgi:hypothetical protein